MPVEEIVATTPTGISVLVPVTSATGAVDDFRILYVNRSGAEMFGHPPTASTGRTIGQLVPPALAELLVDRYRRVYEDREPFSDVLELPDEVLSGWVSVTARVLDEFLVVTYLDVTTEMRARQRERMASERMRRAFERIPDAVFAIDREWRFTYLNAQAERLLERKADELVGRVVWEEYPGIAEHRRLLEDALELGEPVTFDAVHLPAPLDRPFGVRLYPDDVGLTVYFTELGPVQRLEERAAYLERLEMIATLAGGIAHDFNNLLMVISGHASLLGAGLEPGSEAREDVDAIAEAATRAAELTAQLLTFSRQQVLQPSTVDLNDLVRERLDDWRREAGDHIVVDSFLEEDPVLVRVDRSEVTRALDHLVENAIDAMPEGGRLVVETSRAADSGALVLPSQEVPDGVFGVVTVTDDGVGMDAGTLSRAYEPFFTTKSRADSSGLGLSVAHGAARQVGGRLAIYSEPGVGTTVRLYLPASGEGAATPRPPSLGDGADASGTETILVVDDNPSVRALTARILTDRGYEVLSASDPERALEIVDDRGAGIAMLVVDVVMPGRTGHELAVEVQRRLGAIPVLYVSGYTENSVIARGVPADGVQFLAKPYAPAELAARIRRLLDTAG